MANDLARKMIETFLQPPGDAISDISRRGPNTYVTAGRMRWLVETVAGDSDFTNSPSYNLYQIRRADIVADPPLPPQGVAVLPDGAMFHLNDKEGLRAFWRRMRDTIVPLELASLLARYQGGEPRQNLVLTLQDILQVLTKEQLNTLPDFTLPQVPKLRDRSWSLAFCTFMVNQESPDYEFRASVSRWDVESDSEGELQWLHRVIAAGLRCHAYSDQARGRRS